MIAEMEPRLSFSEKLLMMMPSQLLQLKSHDIATSPTTTTTQTTTSSLPLSCFQGIFQSKEYGIITTYEAGSTTLLFDLKATEGNPDLSGVICPWVTDNTVMAVCELPLLGYRNYTDPVMMFEFEVDHETGVVHGFHFNLDEGAPPVQFTKISSL